MTNPSGRDGRRRLDLAALFLGCLAVYLACGQSVFFKADGHHLVLRLRTGDPHYPHHKLYMPILIGFGRLLEPLGLSHYRMATAFSAFGVALGVAATYAGFRRLGSGRWPAWPMALLVALCPACFFFATVVEFHGPFFGAAGLAFLATAALFERPTWPRAIVCGLASAFAAGVHASGLVLPGLLLPFCLAVRRRALEGSMRRALVLASLAAAVHALASLAIAAPGQAGGFVRAGFGHPQGIEHLPGVLRVEWLVPFLPVSVTVWAGLLARHARLPTLAFLVGFVPYATAALRLLVGDAESGAYLLPLAIPAAWITVTALARLPLATGLLAVVSAILAVARVRAHDDAGGYRAYASGLTTALQGQPALLMLGDPAELGPCLVFAPSVDLYLLDLVARYPPKEVEALLGLFDSVVRSQRQQGRAVLLTEGGRHLLATESPLLPGGPRLLLHIESAYRLVPAESGAFRAWRLEPPPG